MSRNDNIDDTLLQAFVDGELDAVGCESVVRAMDRSPQVRDYVYRLRRSKDLMKLGFKDAHAPVLELPNPMATPRKNYSFAIVASIVFLVMSMTFVMIGYYYRGQVEMSAGLAGAAVDQHKTERVILHISKSDPKQFSAALSYVETFLEEHKNRRGEIAVIANAAGIDLMRSGVSPVETRVKAMIQGYDNVYFIACANAISGLRQEGIEPNIIANIDTRKPAMDQIIERVQDGWIYVKVSSLLKI
jgi:uncharacterized protein